MGRDNLTGTIDNPSVTAAGNKTGPGNTIVSPGLSNGTSTFSIGWDLAQANVDTTGLTITDIIPLADPPPTSDGYPIIEITEITTATWAGLYPAVLEYQTVGSGSTWISLDTVDGSAATTYTETTIPALPDLGIIPANLITNLRYRFTTDVPPGFSTSNAATIRFFVRDGMTASDYAQVSPPLPYRDYDNCINFTGTYLDENAVSQPIPASQNCANLRISEDTTNGITNIQTSKSRNKSALFPLEDIQFTFNASIDPGSLW